MKIVNVTDTPVRTKNKPVTMLEVAGAIRTAGTDCGWTMIEDGPGNVIGTLRLRTHVVHHLGVLAEHALGLHEACGMR